MDRTEVTKQMKAMYKKARNAKKAGKAAVAKSFKNAGDRLKRHARGLPMPKKEDAAPAAPAAS